MNDIPLIQKADINSINTSIIAIKKQLKQLNEALGLVDVPSIDTSVFVKKSDVVDVVQSGNMNPVTSNAVATSNAMPVDTVTSGDMHSVTSNAVAEELSYSTTEQKTGGVWIDGKPIYRKVIDCGALPNANRKLIPHNISNFKTIIKIYGIAERVGATLPLPYVTTALQPIYDVAVFVETNNIGIVNYTNMTEYTKSYVVVEYTKTTD